MRRILIVEDDLNFLNFLKEKLSKRFITDIAEDGEIALKKIKENKPDLLILDIILPKLDGFSILKWIRENYKDILVILATGKDKLEDIKEGYKLEADYYITKPYKLEEIEKAIELLFILKK